MKDISYGPDSLKVFISVRMFTMERFSGLFGISIWQSEINGNVQVDLTTSKYIFKEVNCLSDFELQYVYNIILEIQQFRALSELAKSG